MPIQARKGPACELAERAMRVGLEMVVAGVKEGKLVWTFKPVGAVGFTLEQAAALVEQKERRTVSPRTLKIRRLAAQRFCSG